MAPVIAAALPAIIGSVVRAIGIGSGAAGVATADGDPLQLAIGGVVTAVFTLWGVIQKIRAEKAK